MDGSKRYWHRLAAAFRLPHIRPSVTGAKHSPSPSPSHRSLRLRSPQPQKSTKVASPSTINTPVPIHHAVNLSFAALDGITGPPASASIPAAGDLHTPTYAREDAPPSDTDASCFGIIPMDDEPLGDMFTFDGDVEEEADDVEVGDLIEELLAASA